METITVKKTELLSIIQENRTTHRTTFEEALKGFKAAAISQLESLLNRLRQGKAANVSLHLPIPQDHTPDYDRAVRMLELHTEDTLCLTEHEFAKYVMDDWNWKREFATLCSGYSGPI